MSGDHFSLCVTLLLTQWCHAKETSYDTAAGQCGIVNSCRAHSQAFRWMTTVQSAGWEVASCASGELTLELRKPANIPKDNSVWCLNKKLIGSHLEARALSLLNWQSFRFICSAPFQQNYYHNHKITLLTGFSSTDTVNCPKKPHDSNCGYGLINSFV